MIPLFNCPDGVNINNCCGSTHPETLMKPFLPGADLGLAHDGDSDGSWRLTLPAGWWTATRSW